MEFVEVYDPTGVVNTRIHPLADRSGPLQSGVIGLLFNGKPNADIFLARVRENFTTRFPGARFVLRGKPTGASRAMTPEMFSALSACDAVVNAFGDSGSPTSWSVYDGFALESAGVPTCTIVTEVFGTKARREAEALGMAALPLIIIPHPVGQLSAERVVQIADDITEDIIFALTGDVEEMTNIYSRESRALQVGRRRASSVETAVTEGRTS